MRGIIESATAVCVLLTPLALRAQAGNGYVGVFGDAAGTIRCMQAPPGVPVTLYVVAKTEGVSADGISGAEFRIEFVNPSGYLWNYTAPESSLVLGDPLGSVGSNISFPSCRPPVSGTVSLGTITVFNTGSGSPTDIIVKRRNPPSNSDYQCALMVQCDTPVYSKACNTAPTDSISCLLQKARLEPILQNDEFATELSGGVAYEDYRYLGYVYRCDGLEGASAEVIVKYGERPAGGHHYSAWVGLQNSTAKSRVLTSRWIQAGFAKFDAVSLPGAYFEWMRRSTAIVNGIPNGWSGIREQFTVFPDNNLTLSVIKDGDNATLTAGPLTDSTVPWSELVEQGGLPMAAWTGEVGNDDVDRMPGTTSGKCKFNKVRYRKVGLDSAQTPYLGTSASQETANGDKSSGTGSFEIWREE